jgi:endonuclease/exonuclease/phosphatase family metal-dependent hydrolase
MAAPRKYLSFAWWNLHDFAHFDQAQLSDPRWPKRPADYRAKRDRIVAALSELFRQKYPDVLAVCEITRRAARDLAAALPMDYNLALSRPAPYEDDFQVAVFYRADKSFSAESPLIPSDKENVPRETRQMIPVHFASRKHVIRLVACHWTALEVRSSEDARDRLADVLRRDTYDFLHPDDPQPGQTRHVVIVGDFNLEPTSNVFESKLTGLRARALTGVKNWRDKQAQKVRLYNAAWRYFGEQFPLGARRRPATAAGTIFHKTHKWRTFDQVLVSPRLVRGQAPFFDEANTRLAPTRLMTDSNGLPAPFQPGTSRGVSDHLPIVGRLVLR